MFSTLKKTLPLLKIDWQEVMTEANTIEASLEKAENFFGDDRSKTYTYSNDLLQQINQFISINENKITRV